MRAAPASMRHALSQQHSAPAKFELTLAPCSLLTRPGRTEQTVLAGAVCRTHDNALELAVARAWQTYCSPRSAAPDDDFFDAAAIH
jgi:hypothetical protein